MRGIDQRLERLEQIIADKQCMCSDQHSIAIVIVDPTWTQERIHEAEAAANHFLPGAWTRRAAADAFEWVGCLGLKSAQRCLWALRLVRREEGLFGRNRLDGACCMNTRSGRAPRRAA